MSQTRVISGCLAGMLLLGFLYATFQSTNSNAVVDPPNLRDSNREAVVEERRSSVAVPHVEFSDITEAAGIHFRHHNGAQGNLWMPEMMGSGCAFFDFDGDRDQDILLVNSSDFTRYGPALPASVISALYRNDGTGNFVDVTFGSGLDVVQYGMGVAIGDFDGDGRPDLYFANLGHNRLFHNEGDGKFVDVTQAAGVAGEADAWSTSCAFFDYDNDADLDLFVCNYGKWLPEIESRTPFSARGKAGAAGLRNYLPPVAIEPLSCQLYRNDGNSTFADVTTEAGIDVQNAETKHSVTQALGIRPLDFDGDGWLDIVVTNDLPPQFLFRNKHDGTFEELGQITGIATDKIGRPIAGMGVDVGYVGLRNVPVIAIGNLSKLPTPLFVLNRSGKGFTEASDQLGISDATLPVTTFGLFFFDYDLDGRLDMFQTNGHIYTPEVAAFNDSEYKQPSQLFWKNVPGTQQEFVPVSRDDSGEAIGKPILGRGAAYADIDGDGDLDILITENASAPLLLRNDQSLGHHWLRVELRGKSPNTVAIGATVRCHVGEKIQEQMVMPARSYLSQVELPLTFGLGRQNKIDSLEVRWPDGTTETIVAPQVDQMIVVEQKVAAKTE